MAKKILLFILLFLFIFLTGCNKTYTNSIGIKEKQTNEFVSLPYEEFINKVDPNTSSSGKGKILYPIKIKYINENISYVIKSSFSSSYEYDIINKGYYDEVDRTVYKYNEKKEEVIFFSVPGSSQLLYEYYGNLYVDIIIKESEKIVGYCLLQLDYDFASTVNGKILKQVYFPNVIKKDITILEESVNYLLNENKEKISIKNIKEQETDKFFYVLDYIYQGCCLNIKEFNVDRTYLIYSDDTSLSLDYNICEIKIKQVNEEKGISFIFRDKELQKTINHIYNIIIKENDCIIGYAVIKLHYMNELHEKYYYDGVYIDILCQYEFINLQYPSGSQFKPNITEELVRELIDSKNFQ